MLKFLPVGLVLVLMIGAIIYIRLFKVDEPAKSATVQKQEATGTKALLLSPINSTETRLSTLEESIDLITKQLTKQAKEGGSSQNLTPNAIPTIAANNETRLKSLEEAVVNLQKQLDTKIPQTTPASSKKTPVYISFGSSGSTTDRNNFYSLDYSEISLDPADFDGYTSVQLEASLRIVGDSGTAYSRLFNQTDQTAVSSSDASTTSRNFVLVSSSGFKLTNGKKTYRVQIKSSDGNDVQIQNTRVKINF